MKEWPSGSQLVLECVSPRGNDLVALGYKYNQRKVICFLFNKTAGSTKPGDPYIARFNDAFKNVAQRKVPRPAVVSNYFSNSNAVDAHNQARQFELGLERLWITHDCWFRIDTTFIGIVVTDAWKAFKHATKQSCSLGEFAESVAYDLMYNTRSADVDNSIIPSRLGGGLTVDVGNGVAHVIPQDVITPTDSVVLAHHFAKNSELDPKGRPRRRACQYTGCNKKMHWRCQSPMCLSLPYKANDHDVTGVFMCQLHQAHHQRQMAQASP